MKIRTKLTLRYLFVTALLVIAVFFVLEELLFPQAGYDMLHILNTRLLAVWAVSFGLLFVIGYFMARSVLKPVSEIVKQVEAITASNLSKRVEVEDHKDEIGELARTFNKTLDRLEESFEAQKMFISNVSHELRTPMAALIAELELSLYKERSSEDYKKVVENALSDARNIEKLSNGLMDLAKASYNTEQISMSAIRLDEVLLDASAMVMKAHSGYNVDLRFEDDTEDDGMVTIRGNDYLLRTAFVNLIENNCKFSSDQSSTVQISFSKHKGKYSINSLVYWVTYVHNVVYSFYRSMIYCYINSTQRCAGSIVIDIIPTNGADKRKFFPFAPYFPVTNVIKRYFYPYFPAIIGIKGYSFPYFPYLSGIMKIKTALYSLFSRLDWHKTVVFPCLGEIYEGIRSLSWEIPVT